MQASTYSKTPPPPTSPAQFLYLSFKHNTHRGNSSHKAVMTRILLISNSTAPSPPLSSSSSSDAEQSQDVMVESDFVVILAALLCALICVVGLVAIARCNWVRRGTNVNGRPAGQTPANRGLKKKFLQALPKYTYDSSSIEKKAIDGATESAADCAICLAEYVDGEEIRVLPQCGHKFHVQCIDLWLRSHSSCPSCRQILVGARCHKCGEFPPVSGVNSQALVPAECHFKAPPECGTSSSGSNSFLP